VKWRPAVGLLLGATVLAATLAYAGVGAVLRTLERLRLEGLLIIVLAHLPIVALMGIGWRLATGTVPTASPRRFIWARLVRDAAAEALPFSQIGGFVLGVRALRLSGRHPRVGAPAPRRGVSARRPPDLPALAGVGFAAPHARTRRHQHGAR
jgi:uncharacterized membrane protein YbhN (UPF0104 family)